MATVENELKDNNVKAAAQSSKGFISRIFSFKSPSILLSLAFMGLLFSVIFFCYFQIQLKTNAQLKTLNDNFEFYKLDLDWKMKLFHEIQNFRNDLKYSHIDNKALEQRIDFASWEHGARIMAFYGSDYQGDPKWIQVIKNFLGYHPTTACRILSNTLDSYKPFMFGGDKAAFQIKLARTIFIDTIRVEHYNKNFRDLSTIQSAAKDVMFYGISRDGEKPVYLGQVKLLMERQAKDQFASVFTSHSESFDTIKMEVVSNHGHPNYTEIYKLKVYGTIDETINQEPLLVAPPNPQTPQTEEIQPEEGAQAPQTPQAPTNPSWPTTEEAPNNSPNPTATNGNKK